MPAISHPLIAAGRRWLLANPRRPLTVSLIVAVGGLALFWFAWAWYRSFPATPTRLSIVEARAQIDGGPAAQWLVIDGITIDCLHEFSENHRLVVPGTVLANPAILVAIDHPEVVACASLEGRPVAGVLSRPDPRRVRRWADRGLALTNNGAPIDILVLRTDAGPTEARLLLFVAIGLILFGAVLYPAVRRQQRLHQNGS